MPELSPRLAILAPTPVVTVTVERGDEQGDEIHFHPGGQGVWVARLAGSLGAQVTLCVTLAGEAGEVLAPLLDTAGVEVRAVPAHGRSGAYIHDRRSGEREPVANAVGPRLWRHETDALYGMMLTAGLDAGVAMLTGPQPPDALGEDFYRRLVGDLRTNGTTVIADVTDGALRGALSGGVDVLKISDAELIAEGLASTREPEDAFAAMAVLQERGARAVVISRRAEPVLALIDGCRFEFAGPRFEPLDPTGAGDSMFAGLGVALASGAELVDAIRLGVAAGALNVTRRGLGSGHHSEIERMVRHVEVRERGGQPAS